MNLNLFTVEVTLKAPDGLSGQVLEHTMVLKAFQKGSFFCIQDGSDGQLYRYPIDNIFRIVENRGGLKDCIDSEA